MSVYTWLSTWVFGKWFTIATFGSGIAIGLGVPVWQNYWVDTSDLSIELSSITRHIPADATIVYKNYSELNVLTLELERLHRTNTLFAMRQELRVTAEARKRIQRGLVTLDELAEGLTAARERAKGLPDLLKKWQARLADADALKPAEVTPQKLRELLSVR